MALTFSPQTHIKKLHQAVPSLINGQHIIWKYNWRERERGGGGGVFRPTSYTDVSLRGMVKWKSEETNTIGEELKKPATVDLIRNYVLTAEVMSSGKSKRFLQQMKWYVRACMTGRTIYVAICDCGSWRLLSTRQIPGLFAVIAMQTVVDKIAFWRTC